MATKKADEKQNTKRPRGRPRKTPQPDADTPKRPVGRPRKTPQPDSEKETKTTVVDEKRKALEKQAEDVIKVAEKYGVEQNYLFITTFQRYTFQYGMLTDLEEQIQRDGYTVKKQYVKGAKNVYANPAIDSYSKISTAANQTVNTLIKIVKSFANSTDDDVGDELLKILGISV